MGDGDLISIEDIQSREEQAYRAYQMRLAGQSWTDVAVRLDYGSPNKAKREVDNLIQKAVLTASDERKSEVVNMELDRLDALQNAVWGMAISGDLKAVDSVLKIMGHRARLLSLGEETRGSVNTVIVADSDYVASLKELAT